MTVYARAYRALFRIFEEGAYLSASLNETESGEDRAKLTFLVYGVLDRAVELDYIIDRNCKSPKPAARMILRLGTFLGRHSRMPVYAAVDECVKLCRELGKPGLCGFINATLKNCIAYPLDPPKDRAAALSLAHSFPIWIVKKYLRQYGTDAETMLAYVPETREHIRIRGDATAFCETLRGAGVDFESSRLADAVFADYAALLAAKIPGERFVKMNEGSMEICRFAAEGETPGEILDACAAPGGKSCYLADLFPHAKVIACDVHPHRLELIRNYARRLGVQNVFPELRDAQVFAPEWEGKFPLVLADVPCSGLGVAYSKPDIKLTRKPEDVSALAETQARILENLRRYVSPGGALVYSTCTTLREENEDVVFRFLRDHSDFEKAAERKWNPVLTDSEGFYAVKLRRRA